MVSRNSHRNAYNIARVELRNEHAHGQPRPHLIFGWFAIRRTATRRDAARHGASLATIFEHSSADESRRAARIDPSSILAARRDAADGARPIKSFQTLGYKGCCQADLINIVNTDMQLNARGGACVALRRIPV